MWPLTHSATMKRLAVLYKMAWTQAVETVLVGLQGSQLVRVTKCLELGAGKQRMPF